MGNTRASDCGTSNGTALTLFLYKPNAKEESPAATHRDMTIARGRTNCQAERDIVLQGFKEQLQILEDSQIEQEIGVKANLYDLVSDISISDEEKSSLARPLREVLQEIDERHIRIRCAVFIGLYSFWEVSLMDIANTYIPTNSNVHSSLTYKSKKSGASNYLKQIYGESLPPLIIMINTNIREFRNYMVHGSLNAKRELLINELMKTHPEFCINASGKSYFFSNYAGLRTLLKILSQELENSESKLLDIKTA